MSIALVIPTCIDPEAPGGVQQLARDASAANKTPLMHVRVSPGPEGEHASDVRRVTLQVTNRRGSACRGCFALRIIVGTSASGGPGGAQTLTIVTGAMIASVAADQVIDVLTDADGRAVVDVEVAGAGVRFVRAALGGVVFGTDPITWA